MENKDVYFENSCSDFLVKTIGNSITFISLLVLSTYFLLDSIDLMCPWHAALANPCISY